MGHHDKHCAFSGSFFFVKYNYNDTYINSDVNSMTCIMLTKN